MRLQRDGSVGKVKAGLESQHPYRSLTPWYTYVNPGLERWRKA